MTYDVRAFLTGVLHELGAPVTDSGLLALIGQHACEVGSQPPAQWARFNPLNTTLPQPGDSWYNSFGPGGAYHVRNYPDLTTGVRATALTIGNGNYPAYEAALRRGDAAREVMASAEIRHELDVWGTGGSRVAFWLHEHGGATTPPPAPPAVHPHLVYVVRPGDSLSGIAARYRIKGGWKALYQANRHTIGANPNTIRPGERLAIP